MPQIIIDLPDPLNTSLATRAASRGLSVEDYLSQLAEQDIAQIQPSPKDTPTDDWQRRFAEYLAFVDKNGSTATDFDDRRDSIYKDCGE